MKKNILFIAQSRPVVISRTMRSKAQFQQWKLQAETSKTFMKKPLSRSLLLIDDQKLRNEVFSATASILKQIQSLENDHQAFMKWDQRLYEDWYNLIFRKEREETEALKKRYQILCTFQLHLLYLAEKSNLSLEKAYALLQEEERQYQNGDEEWRFVIDRLRQHRLQFAQKNKANLQRKFQSPPPLPLNTLFDLQETFQSDSAPQESAVSVPDLSRLKRKDRALYYYLKEIPKVSLQRHLSSHLDGYELFRKAFHITIQCGDWNLLAKLWNTSCPAFQQNLLKMMPAHMTDFISQMITESQILSPTHDAEKSSNIKTIYRKLVRLLHPDKQHPLHSEKDLERRQKLWQQVQEAYQNKNLLQLRRLELISLVHLGHLNSLTLDEIYETSLIFKEELDKLKTKLKSCRKHPAWKFTSRRSYQTLVNKTREEIHKQQAPLLAEVEKLENLLNFENPVRF